MGPSSHCGTWGALSGVSLPPGSPPHAHTLPPPGVLLRAQKRRFSLRLQASSDAFWPQQAFRGFWEHLAGSPHTTRQGNGARICSPPLGAEGGPPVTRPAVPRSVREKTPARGRLERAVTQPPSIPFASHEQPPGEDGRDPLLEDVGSPRVATGGGPECITAGRGTFLPLYCNGGPGPGRAKPSIGPIMLSTRTPVINLCLPGRKWQFGGGIKGLGKLRDPQTTPGSDLHSPPATESG